MRYLVLAASVLGVVLAVTAGSSLRQDYNLLTDKVLWQEEILKQYRSGAPAEITDKNHAALDRFYQDREPDGSAVPRLALIWIGVIIYGAAWKARKTKKEDPIIIGHRSPTD